MGRGAWLTTPAGKGAPLTVEIAPTSTAVFELVRRDIEFFGEDNNEGDAGWGLNPWLTWDEQPSQVGVNIGRELIGYLNENDSAELGEAVKKSSDAPVAHMWLNEPGEIQTWIYV